LQRTKSNERESGLPEVFVVLSYYSGNRLAKDAARHSANGRRLSLPTGNPMRRESDIEVSKPTKLGIFG
jgi:hypothetical protein